MAITVTYFAAAADAAGTDRDILELDAATIGALRSRITEEHPGMADLLEVCTFMVGDRLVRDDDVTVGDRVDVLPPFSGG